MDRIKKAMGLALRGKTKSATLIYELLDSYINEPLRIQHPIQAMIGMINAVKNKKHLQSDFVLIKNGELVFSDDRTAARIPISGVDGVNAVVLISQLNKIIPDLVSGVHISNLPIMLYPSAVTFTVDLPIYNRPIATYDTPKDFPVRDSKGWMGVNGFCMLTKDAYVVTSMELGGSAGDWIFMDNKYTGIVSQSSALLKISDDTYACSNNLGSFYWKSKTMDVVRYHFTNEDVPLAKINAAEFEVALESIESEFCHLDVFEYGFAVESASGDVCGEHNVNVNHLVSLAPVKIRVSLLRNLVGNGDIFVLRCDPDLSLVCRINNKIYYLCTK